MEPLLFVSHRLVQILPGSPVACEAVFNASFHGDNTGSNPVGTPIFLHLALLTSIYEAGSGLRAGRRER